MTKKDVDQLAALATSVDGEPPNLLAEMMGLRRDLRNQRFRDWLWRIVLLAGVVTALSLWNGQRHQTDQILATRANSRVATCQALDGMYAKHNNFVQTAIDERQALIDATNAGSASDAQKQASTTFFDNQIANYQRDLVPIVNCNDPVQVATLFTPTPGG